MGAKSEDCPTPRKLDGVFFRVERDGEWRNVCYSDMTQAERDEVIGDRPARWWKSLAEEMAECLRAVGDELDIVSA